MNNAGTWFMCIIGTIFLALVFVAVHTKPVCKAWSTVMYVGSCDRDGFCAVAFPDRGYSREYHPEIGREVCRRFEDEFVW